jgi:aspartate 1-decarboxylase
MENEKVDIYDVTNGARISTYVIPGIPGSGEVGINGAAAHLVNAGDLVIIANYGWMSTSEGEVLEPKVVFVDEKNQIVRLATQERTPAVEKAFI